MQELIYEYEPALSWSLGAYLWASEMPPKDAITFVEYANVETADRAWNAMEVGYDEYLMRQYWNDARNPVDDYE